MSRKLKEHALELTIKGLLVDVFAAEGGEREEEKVTVDAVEPRLTRLHALLASFLQNESQRRNDVIPLYLVQDGRHRASGKHFCGRVGMRSLLHLVPEDVHWCSVVLMQANVIPHACDGHMSTVT